MTEIIVSPDLRGKVLKLEHAMQAMEQIDIPIKHYFSQGVYAREMTVPKGATVVGKIHKYEQLNILSAGEVSVVTDEGVQRVKAPFTLVAPPGAKRAFYAHEDSVWTVIHGTEERDVEKIELQFIAQSELEYKEFCALTGEIPWLGSQPQ